MACRSAGFSHAVPLQAYALCSLESARVDVEICQSVSKLSSTPTHHCHHTLVGSSSRELRTSAAKWRVFCRPGKQHAAHEGSKSSSRCRIATRAQQSLAPRAVMSLLWSRIQQMYHAAEESGALFKIRTKPLGLRDATLELDFRLQVSEALKEKPPASSQSGGGEKPEDVFAVRDEELSVDEHLTPSHVLRLNKFNVVPYHSLVITREFEPQTARLTEADWEATLQTVQAYPEGALAYFNGGEDSGSSQPRKHLQVLPLAIDGASTAPLPLSEISRAAFSNLGLPPLEAVELRRLPFQSFAAALPASTDAAGLHRAYENLMAARPAASRAAHYNVLWAGDCMLLVPRRREKSGLVGCNALVFAGTLLVRHTTELDFIHNCGPLRILEDVCFPWEAQRDS